MNTELRKEAKNDFEKDNPCTQSAISFFLDKFKYKI